MMRIRSFIVMLILLLPSFASGQAGLGVSPPISEVTYAQSKVTDLSFTILPMGEDWVRLFVLGDIKNDSMIIFKDIEDPGDVHLQGTRKVFFDLNITPEDEIPGNHRIKIYVEQKDPPKDKSKPVTNGISARVAVAHVIKLFIPYTKPFLKMEFTKATSVQKGDNAFFAFHLSNLGRQPINDLIVNIDLFDKDDKKVGTVNTPVIDLAPLTEQDVFTEWETKGAGVGRYRAVATAKYSDEIRTAEQAFLVGEVTIKINDIRFNTTLNVAKIFADIESQWNEVLKGVTPQVNINAADGKTLETVKGTTFDIAPWEKQTLMLYFEKEKYQYGTYTAEVVLNFEGKDVKKSKEFYLTKEAIVEKPASIFTATNFLLTVIAVLLIFLLVLLGLYLKSLQPQRRK